ncbi:hypothetical protein D3C80_1215960 [compost metagenome]
MRPGHARLQVDTREYVVVVPDDTAAVTPGSAGGVAVVLAFAVQVGGGCPRTRASDGAAIERLAGIGATGGWQRTWAEHRVATVAGIVGILQAADMGDTHFTDYSHPAGAHHLVEEMGQGGLELGDLLTAIPMQVLPRRTGQQRCVAQRATNGTDTGEQDIRGIELHWRIGAVADFAAPGGASG